MDRMYSFCIKHGYNMMVDGTFSNLKKAHENIRQCQKRKLAFSVILVMQDPIISYLYTKKREQEKLRNVPTEVFVQKYYQSIEVVREIMNVYPQVLLFVTKKLKSNPKFSDIQIKNRQQLSI
jgi:Zeta toxin